MQNESGTIGLIGSGEFGEGMARVYRAIIARTESEPHAVFLDTPAGFETNSDQISVKAREYFARHLNLALEIASYKNSKRATAHEIATALGVLLRANFILAGPGSPTYVTRNWRGSPVWDSVLNRFSRGAHLVFASAAAISMGAWALPVYEIYKAGSELFWSEGLNLFRVLNMQLAIVPHWNNHEGAHDTRFCFMGAERFHELEALLPAGTTILGIDEQTACVFDPGTQMGHVMGAGNVTIRCDGNEWSYASGQTFPFARLQSAERSPMTPANRSLSESAPPEPDETTRYLAQLARALNEAVEPEVKRDLIDRAHNAIHEMSADWLDNSHTVRTADPAPYVEALIHVRKELRDAKQYALADDIRKRLLELGIELQDSGTGTTWRRVGS